MSGFIFLDNDMRLKLAGLVDAEGTYQNTATVEATLYDDAGNAVSGPSWPLTMDYVSSSNGDYTVNLEDTIDFTGIERVLISIDVDSAGLQANFTKRVNVVPRRV